ncbi:MAG: hypothetical protein LBH00_07550, partial [Planctomycetaceae bacterium]|nr:hypothetical protein [Planctomycetaceae bacterium]
MMFSESNNCWISPPVNGWCFLFCRIDSTGKEESLLFLNRLSRFFGEACFFGTHRISSYAAWIRSVNGRIVRSFITGDSGNIVNQGERTGIETGAAYMLIDIEDEADTSKGRPQWADNEDWVMQIAGDWTVNPQDLGDEQYQTEKQLGIAGVLP